MATDFLGKGLGFPFHFERRSGGAHVSSANTTEHEHIQESIIQILGTSPGERFMLPEFGSRLKSLVFEANDEVLKGPDPALHRRGNQAVGQTSYRHRRYLRSVYPGDRPPLAASAHLLPRRPDPSRGQPGLSLPSRAVPGPCSPTNHRRRWPVKSGIYDRRRAWPFGRPATGRRTV